MTGQCWLHYGAALAISRSRVRFQAAAVSRSDPGHVVHTLVPLSPTSIIWYQFKGCGGLRLGK